MIKRRSKKDRQLARLLIALDAAAGERRFVRARRSAPLSAGAGRQVPA